MVSRNSGLVLIVHTLKYNSEELKLEFCFTVLFFYCKSRIFP